MPPLTDVHDVLGMSTQPLLCDCYLLSDDDGDDDDDDDDDDGGGGGGDDDDDDDDDDEDYSDGAIGDAADAHRYHYNCQ